MIKRNNPTLIPELEELNHILSLESQRRVPKEKLYSNLGLVDFRALFRLFDSLNIEYNSNDFIDFHTDLTYYLSYSANLISQIVFRIQNLYRGEFGLEILRPDLDSIYNYLSQDDADLISKNNEKYDYGFVFGSSGYFRVKKAIELYHLGKIAKIFISGKGPIYANSNINEAENLANYALERGVSVNDLIIENQSLTVQDNVKRSLDLKDNQKLDISSLVLITSPFAMRRAYINWLKFLPTEMSTKLLILRCNSEVSHDFNGENWYKSEKSLRVVLNEYFKIRGEWIVDKTLFDNSEA
jgi:hypothetical protein